MKNLGGKKVQFFYNLNAWQSAHKLTLEIYTLTKDFPLTERYGIVSQIQRASSSIGANIAEGFGRYHFKEKIRFYYIARGSIHEVQNFLYLAKDLKYINIDQSRKLFIQSKKISKLLGGLIRSTQNQL